MSGYLVKVHKALISPDLLQCDEMDLRCVAAV